MNYKELYEDVLKDNEILAKENEQLRKENEKLKRENYGLKETVSNQGKRISSWYNAL